MKLDNLPLFVGGFMGPFGTIIVVPMYPELRTAFDASATGVVLSLSLYLVPFAALLLVSGTLGERWGRRRTIRGAYLAYAATSVACMLAPTLGVFVAARAAQGAANAFITPLLMAGLAEKVAPERFGRAAGVYASFQALGAVAGPLVGGLAADIEWRSAFAGTAIVALILSLFPPPGLPRPGLAAPDFGELINRRLIGLAVSFFFAAAGPLGVGVLVGIAVRDVYGLDGTPAGLILASGSLAAFASGPVFGSIVDRIGSRRAAIVSAVVATFAAAALAFGVGPWRLGLLWTFAGALISFFVVVYQGIGATILPNNRSGALSFLLSFRFFGLAVGPIVFSPLISWSVSKTFLLASALGIVSIALTAAAAPSRQRKRTAA